MKKHIFWLSTLALVIIPIQTTFAGGDILTRIQAEKELHSAIRSVELLRADADLARRETPDAQLLQPASSAWEISGQRKELSHQFHLKFIGFQRLAKDVLEFIGITRLSIEPSREAPSVTLSKLADSLTKVYGKFGTMIEVIQVPMPNEYTNENFVSIVSKVREGLDYVSSELDKVVVSYKEILTQDRVEVRELIDLARRERPKLFTEALEQEIRNLELQKGNEQQSLAELKSHIKLARSEMEKALLEHAQCKATIELESTQVGKSLLKLKEELEKEKARVAESRLACERDQVAIKKKCHELDEELATKKKWLDSEVHGLEQALVQKKKEHAHLCQQSLESYQSSCRAHEGELHKREEQQAANLEILEQSLKKKKQETASACQSLETEFSSRKKEIRNYMASIIATHPLAEESPTTSPVVRIQFQGGVSVNVSFVNLDGVLPIHVSQESLEKLKNDIVQVISSLTSDANGADKGSLVFPKPKHVDLGVFTLKLKVDGMKKRWLKDDTLHIQAVATSAAKYQFREPPGVALFSDVPCSLKDGTLKESYKERLKDQFRNLLSQEKAYTEQHSNHYIKMMELATTEVGPLE